MKHSDIHIAIVGNGRLGTAVAEQLRVKGIRSTFLTKDMGFDITQKVSFDKYGRFDAVVEATDIFTNNQDIGIPFFTSSTKNINKAVLTAGIAKHILITIVNVDDPDLRRNGYYASKAAQLDVALNENGKMTIIRSTQWYEFARQNLNRMKVGPFAIIPQMKVRPVALDSVAKVVAECCSNERQESTYSVCGPEIMTLWEMTKKLSNKKAIPVPVIVPGKGGKALKNGALLPKSNTVEILEPIFSEWLKLGNQ